MVRRVGKLNRRVEILRPEVLLDELGRRTRQNDWKRLALVWAEIRELNGSEPQIAKQIVGQVSIQVRIRFRADVNTQCRLQYRGRMLEIKSAIDQDGLRREQLLFCGEVV